MKNNSSKAITLHKIICDKFKLNNLNEKLYKMFESSIDKKLY